MNMNDPNQSGKDYTESAKKHAATGKVMMLISWCLILGICYVYFAWHSRSSAYDTETKFTQDRVEIHIPLTRGNSYEVFGHINNYKVLFLIDTGASIVAVSDEIAAKAGLKKGLPIKVHTAAGETTAYLTKIKKLIINKQIVLYNVNATINPDMHEDTVLLGMGALKQIEFQHTRNTLILKEVR